MALPVIPVGKWVELPNTDFGVWADANGVPKGLPFGDTTSRTAIFSAWTSGLFDRQRQRWVTLRAGGHADWAGNGVYAFSLATLQWSQLRGLFNFAATTYGSQGYPPQVGNETNQLFEPSKIRVHSNDPTDTRTATITGENTSGTVVSETVQINGTNVVLTTTTFRWLNTIVMSGPNIGVTRRAHFRREDNTTGVWPTSATNFNPSSAFQVTRFSGPFNILNLDQTLGASAYYVSTPTVASTTEPSSVHTYDSQEHLRSHDVYYSGGGIWWGFGDSTPHTVWLFDPNTNAWHMPSSGTTTRPGGSGSAVVWDPVLNLLWLQTSSAGLYTYDYPTNTWTLRRSGSMSTAQSKLTIDAARRRLYLVTPLSGTSVQISILNIANPSAVVLTQITPTGTIDIRKANSSQFIEGLGAVFAGGRIAVYGRDSTGLAGGVYSVDPDNPVWVNHDPTDNVKPPLPEGTGGIWNKFFSPDDIHLMFIWGEGKNVWAFRMPWSSATPFRPIALTAAIR